VPKVKSQIKEENNFVKKRKKIIVKCYRSTHDEMKN